MGNYSSGLFSPLPPSPRRVSGMIEPLAEHSDKLSGKKIDENAKFIYILKSCY